MDVSPQTLVMSSKKRWRPPTAIPAALRSFGCVPDYEQWHPGDLILTAADAPDSISKMIANIQKPGYGAENALWTHAAVYLGDQLMLCEAQIDPPAIMQVIVAPIWSYIGTHRILVKRSKHALDKESGWAIATAAATKIGQAYDWKFILKLAADRVLFGEDVLVHDHSGKISVGAYVCSSLYSTARAYVTDVTITDKTNGLCIPASLASNHKHLDTVPFDWCAIE